MRLPQKSPGDAVVATADYGNGAGGLAQAFGGGSRRSPFHAHSAT